MAALKSNPAPRDPKSEDADATPLERVMREYEELVVAFETGLLRSLEYADTPHNTNANDNSNTPELKRRRQDTLRQNAGRLALAELSTRYTRKQIRRSLNAAEGLGKRVEDRLHIALDAGQATENGGLDSLPNGYFRLYSTELFDLLGQPTDLRFGTLRFHTNTTSLDSGWTSLELALNSSFFVADSTETLPYHAFHLPQTPSLQNRGIRSRKAEDNGAFPAYDSWLLFTFLGDGCMKVEIPIEMCADVYGGPLRGRENEEILFWAVFVQDDTIDQ